MTSYFLDIYTVSVTVRDGGVVNVGDNTSVNTSPTSTPNILNLNSKTI